MGTWAASQNSGPLLLLFVQLVAAVRLGRAVYSGHGCRGVQQTPLN